MGLCDGRPAGKLTDRQAIFVAEYLKDLNGARAAEAAGYSRPAVAAAKLLNPELYPHVVAAVQEGLAKKREDCGIEARRIVEELSHTAFLTQSTLSWGTTGSGPFGTCPGRCAAPSSS